MINKRMTGLGTHRSAIRDLFEYGLCRKREIGEDRVFDFSLGNPSVPAPDEVNRELVRLITEVEPTSLHGYTSAAGDASVRTAVAEYITKTHGFPVTAGDIYMTVGAAAALTCTLHALVCPGEEVIVLTPYFPEYRVFIEGTGASVVEVDCDPVSFHPVAEKIAAAITEKTAAIIVNSPNNPSGAVYSREDIIALSAVLTAAEQRYAHPIYLISDEPYRELVYDGAEVPFIPDYYADTVVCYSFSKSLSIPGERIGYVLVSPRVTDNSTVYASVAGAGRSLGYVCAPALLQKVLPACLGLTSDVSVYDRNRRLLYEALTSYGFTVVKPDGAFYMFVKAPVPSAVEFCEAAKRHELLIVPSDSFGVSGYVRISYCVGTQMIENSLPAFRALAEEYGILPKE